MPVYFPDHLVVATRGVEIRNARPELGGWTPFMDGIEEPVDLCGWTNGHVAIAQQIARTFEKPIRLSSGIFHGAGNVAADRGDERRAHSRVDGEAPWTAREMGAECLGGAPVIATVE